MSAAFLLPQSRRAVHQRSLPGDHYGSSSYKDISISYYYYDSGHFSMTYGELRHYSTTHGWKPAEQHVNQGLDNTGDSTWDHVIGAWSSDEAVELGEAL